MADNTRRRTAGVQDPGHQPADPQVQTTDERLELFEVLVEARNGHRSVHRVQAKDRSAAGKSVAETLDEGAVVVAAARAGLGLGSGG
jgi:hypothetical protein